MDTTNRTQTGQTTILYDLNTFTEFLSLLIMACEKMKVDSQTTKEDLLKAKRKAQETKRKAAEERGTLAVANAGLGIAAAAAVILTGGLALPIMLSTGHLITSICSKEINKEYEANIERIIAAVDHRSEKSKQRARMVINKRKTYETTLNSLKGRGIEENEAIFYAIVGMISEMIQSNYNGTFSMVGENIAIMDTSELGIQQSDLMQKMIGNGNVGLIGFGLASTGNYIPEWFSNGVKNVAKELPKFAPKFVAVATILITAMEKLPHLTKDVSNTTIGYEVCSAIRFAWSKNKAVDVIDEAVQLFNEGESGLDFFIGVFTTARIHALQKLKEHQNREEMKARNTTIMIICIVFGFFAFILALIKL